MEFPVDDSSEDLDELAGRLRRGDQEALAVLFARYRDRLWRMIDFRMDHRLTGRVDPDDVLQEAYLATADRMKGFDGNGSTPPFVWLRRMVLQTLTDLHRRHLGAQMRSAGREVVMEGCRYPQSTSASMAALFVAHLTSPSQAAVRAETLDRVEEAVAGMDPLDREVLALRHFEELDNCEVAQVLGIQQKAASIRYVRALKRLKTVLAQMPDLFGGDGDV
jgi:RNA polymerase sigma-70 factor (ECF subfamily)